MTQESWHRAKALALENHFNLLTVQWQNIPSLSSACTSAQWPNISSAWFHYFSQHYSQQSLWCFLPQETPGFPLRTGKNDVAVTFHGNYKPMLWKSDPLRFTGLPPHVEKKRKSLTVELPLCVPFLMFIHWSNVSMSDCLWSVCYPYSLLLSALVLMIWQMQWCQPKKHVPQKLSNFSR